MSQKFIVFDWNGTLVDDVAATCESLRAALRAYGRPLLTDAEIATQWVMPPRVFMDKLGISEAEHEGFLKAFNDAFGPHVAQVKLRKDADSVLRQFAAQGIPRFVLSNHQAPKIRAMAERLGIGDVLTEVLAFPDAAAQRAGTPKQELLRNALAVCRLDAKDGMFVGDAVEDVNIARVFGMTAIALTGGMHQRAQLAAARPDHMIDKLGALIDLVHLRQQAG